MAIEPIPNSRFVRHTVDDLTLGERPRSIPSPHFQEIDTTVPYMPALPAGFADDESQLARAHSGARERAKEIRKLADAAWNDEPPRIGVALTGAQRWAWKRQHVAEIVKAEIDKTGALLRPVVAKASKDIEKRRAMLIEKGTPRLDGIPASRAMAIANHFSTLPAETRALRISEALQQPNEPDARELLTSLAWAPRSLDLAAPEMIDLIKGTLIASADPEAYQAVTTLDGAIQATTESLDNLEKWGLSLADEN